MTGGTMDNDGKKGFPRFKDLGLEYLDRRTFPPVPTRVRAEFYCKFGNEYRRAQAVELSQEGVFFKADRPWPVGSRVEISQLRLLNDAVGFEGAGVVEKVDYFALIVGGFPSGMFIRFTKLVRSQKGLMARMKRMAYQRKNASSIALDIGKYAFAEIAGSKPGQEFGKPHAGVRTPVLLLHGFMGTQGVMFPLEKRLERAGFPVTSVYLGLLNMQDIRLSARRIAEEVDAICCRHKYEKIDIVGHSMGGLIAMYYLKFLGGEKFVKKLIAIGTPFRGSLLANLLGVPILGAVSKSVWQIAKGSGLLRELDRGPLPPGVKIYSIFAKNDMLAMPGDAAILGARNYMISMGHSGLVVGEEAFNYIQAILADRDPLPLEKGIMSDGDVRPLRNGPYYP